MAPSEMILALATPYVFAWLTTLIVQRVNVLPVRSTPDVMAQNTVGKLVGRQRLALLTYNAPELIFAVVALLIAILWQPNAGLNGTVLRWGLGGMALVRLGISFPQWRDLISGQVTSLRGPLRKIKFGSRRALATEGGPIIVLPVERALFDAYEAGADVTIYYATGSKRALAVEAHNVPDAAGNAVTSQAAPAHA